MRFLLREKKEGLQKNTSGYVRRWDTLSLHRIHHFAWAMREVWKRDGAYQLQRRCMNCRGKLLSEESSSQRSGHAKMILVCKTRRPRS